MKIDIVNNTLYSCWINRKDRIISKTLLDNVKCYANPSLTTTNYTAHFAFSVVHNLDGMQRL